MKTKLLVLLLAVFFTLLAFSNSFAIVTSFTHTVKQSFSGSQSPDDARVAAMAKAKREVLEKAGTYLETLTVVKNSVLEKDEILALAAGVLRAEIVSQRNYVTVDAFGIIIKAKVDVDTGILKERVRKLLEERKYEKELLSKIAKLEEENRILRVEVPYHSENGREDTYREDTYNKQRRGLRSFFGKKGDAYPSTWNRLNDFPR